MTPREQDVAPRPGASAPPVAAPARPAARQVVALAAALAVLVAPVLLAWGGWRWLRSTRGFAVRHVAFTGVVHADAASLERATKAVGRNAFALDLAAVRSRLLDEPWVAEATVRRALPHELRATIVERVPVALVDGGRALVAADGRILMETPPRDRFPLPEITGLGGRAPEDREAARRLAAQTLQAVREAAPEWSPRVESIDASSGERLVIVAKDCPPIWVSGPESADELAAWARRERGIAAAIGRASWVDARWRDRLYVVPARRTGA